MQDFIDSTPQIQGTSLNRANLMAIQGFVGCRVELSENKIVERYSNGCSLTTTFEADGSITEVFTKNKTITKTTRFSGNEVITEVVI